MIKSFENISARSSGIFLPLIPQVKNKIFSVQIVNFFLSILFGIYVLGAQKNHLIEMVLLSTQHMF